MPPLSLSEEWGVGSEERTPFCSRLTPHASRLRRGPALRRAGRAVRPDFDLTRAAGAIAVEICRRLDGLPLAIELAAARLGPPGAGRHARPPRGAAAPADRGARDAPARHRTMRDAIAWSVDLLTPPDRLLFARLGVFAGSFTLEAAEYVGGAAGGLRGCRHPLSSSMGWPRSSTPVWSGCCRWTR